MLHRRMPSHAQPGRMARHVLFGRMTSTEPSPPPARPRRRAWRIALGVLVALAAFAWAFDWNWFIPPIRHYVMSHSGRRFDCDDLKVRFHGSLDPTIEMRNLTIQNAPWAASPAPFIHAGYAAATISWRTLGSDMTVLEMIVLRDAQVDMERQANGIRNWRLGHPDDTGPPRVRVLAVDAQRSTLHTVHAGIGLVGDARIEPLPAPAAVSGHPDLPLTKHLTFDATYQGHAFDVDTAVSDVLTLGATSHLFSLRGTANLGGLRVAAEGVSNDAHALGDVDLDATLTTHGDGPLWPLPAAFARVRPLVVRGHVKKADTTWTASALHASLGHRTAVAGDVHFVGSLKDAGQRRILDAVLHDAVLDIDDLRALAGKPADTADTTKADAAADARKTPFAIPATPLPTARLREFDADVDLKNARIVGSPDDLAQSLRVHATLAAGALRVSEFDLAAADGHVTGTLQFDAARAPSELALDLRARGVDIARLSAKLAKNQSLIGRVDAHAQLRAQGDSPRALASSAAGTVNASLAPGASVSKRLDAKLSLDGGEWLRSLFDKSERVPVQCAELTLAVANGTGTSRRFAFETDHTALAGRGAVNAIDETLDATLTPTRKTTALLALDKAIHASGPWRDVKIKLEPPATDAAPQRCGAAAK